MQKIFATVMLMALLVWSLVATWISCYETFYFWHLSIDSTIATTQLVCEMPLKNRCVTHYITKNSDGTVGELVPFGYQFEPKALRGGAHIFKHSNGFSYWVNGKAEQWPFLWQHICVSIGGLLGLCIWAALKGPKFLSDWLHSFHRAAA